MASVRKPFNWIGGKGRSFAKIKRFLPERCEVYAEPYAGSLALLFTRQPALVEIANDIDPDVVNVYEVFTNDDEFLRLKSFMRTTLHSRAEFARAIEILNDKQLKDKALRAWAFIVCTTQALSSQITNVKPENWGRALRYYTWGIGAANVHLWNAKFDYIDRFHERLKNLRVENIDGIDFMLKHDAPNVVYYVDPPYPIETRSNQKSYRYDVDDEYHHRLVDVLLGLKAAVTLSGYLNSIYTRLEKSGWLRYDFESVTNSIARTRDVLRKNKNPLYSHSKIECVWINQRAQEMLNAQKGIQAF